MNQRLIGGLTAVVVATAVAVASTFVAPVQVSDAASGSRSWSNDVDAASSALPTDAQPSVDDGVQDVVRIKQSDPKATAVSTASSTCDGCRAAATTFQVVYFDGAGPAKADNVATAWSGCANCESSAVSVQVVVVRRSDQVTVNNRALALNVLCGSAEDETGAGCQTSSVALQFVLVGGSRRDLTAATKSLLEQLQTELADRLATGDPSAADSRMRAMGEVDSVADRLQNILVTDTGATSVQRNVDVQTGS
jgi:hypothetical protein